MAAARRSLRSALLAGAAAAVVGSAGGRAEANGAFPAAGQLIVDPGDPSHLVLRTNFGLVTTRDAGVTWDWICESAIGYSNYEPPIAVTGDGSVLAALFTGVAVAHGDRCGWSLAAGADQVIVADVSVPRFDSSMAVALAGDGTTYRYFESTDQAASFAQVGVDLPAGFYALTVDVAASDPARIYASGLRQIAGVYFGAVARSVDHGATWTTADIPGSDAVTAPYLAAIDPVDPDRVYVRLDTAPGRLVVSDDGAQTFTDAFSGRGFLRGFALSPDGAKVLVGGELDGVWRAPTSTLAFAKVSDVGVTCLVWAESGLYACGRDVTPMLVGVSADEGATFDSLLPLACLRGPLACAADTSAGMECPGQWPTLQVTIDAASCPEGTGGAGGAGGGAGGGDGGGNSQASGGPGGNSAAATGAGGVAAGDAAGPASGDGCGCRAVGATARGAGGGETLGVGLLLAGIAWARRRSRR